MVEEAIPPRMQNTVIPFSGRFLCVYGFIYFWAGLLFGSGNSLFG